MLLFFNSCSISKLVSSLNMWLYLIIVLIFLLCIWFLDYFKAVLLALSLKGPPALPFLGNALLLNSPEKLEDLGNNIIKYGTIARCWISILPVFIIYEPEFIQTIIGSSKVSEKNLFYSFLHNFIGDGLITNNGTKWRTHRNLIQPCFHINILKNYIKIFSKHSKHLVQRLEQGEVKISNAVNSSVIRILHGKELESADCSSPFRKGKLMISYRITRPWLLLKPLFSLTSASDFESQQKSNLHSYTLKVLEERLREPKHESLLDLFLQISEEKQFTKQDIIDEICTFMLAGQDSVASAISFCLYHLAANQAAQNKAYLEIKSMNNEEINYKNLSSLKYLEQCIKESLRLSPSVPMIARVLTENIKLGQLNLPKGSNIIISPYVTHRLPHVFPEPLIYNPDRFSENSKQHPFAYIPFSAGPRNCIGYKFALLEIKTILATILQSYELHLPEDHNIQLLYRVSLRAKGGIRLKLHPRK